MSIEKTNTEIQIVIGELIKEQFHKSELSVDQFADLIGCNRRNVYKLFLKEDISTDQLKRISKVLNFNFFNLYSELLNNETIQIQLNINLPRAEMEKGNICKYCDKNKLKI